MRSLLPDLGKGRGGAPAAIPEYCTGVAVQRVAFGGRSRHGRRSVVLLAGAVPARRSSFIAPGSLVQAGSRLTIEGSIHV